MSGSSSILFIVGPTAVGKSSIAFHLAQHIQADIISCDAMQVYRDVSIVTDKPTAAMRAAVPHHLVDVVGVDESFDVVKYRDLAEAVLQRIQQQQRSALVVGGSGMYMSVLLDGIFADVPRDASLRARFEQLAHLEGRAALHERLRAVDEDSAERIHPHDLKRMVRALEVFAVTGKPISQLQKTRQGWWGVMPITVVGLTRDRQVLYTRAEQRIDQMMEEGLVDEVQQLRAKALTPTAARMIGVPEIGGYLDGEYDLDQAVYLMKRNTRHYIKRQLTWFRRDPRVQWVDMDGLAHDEVLERIKSVWQEGRTS